MPESPATLHESQNLPLQFREWRIQRIAWIFIAMFVLAAMLGVFGGMGPLAQATARDESGRIVVEHPRFARLQSPQDLRITIPAGLSDRLQLWVGAEFADAVEITRIEPEPESVEVGSDRITYEFALSDRPDGAQIIFHYSPQLAGAHGASLGIEGFGHVAFRTFVYP